MNKKMIAGLLLLLLAAPASAQEKTSLPARSVVYSPDGKLLVIGLGTREAGGEIVVWNLEKKSAEKRHPLAETRGISSLAFAPDGKRLALSTFNRPPRVLKWPTLELEFECAKERHGQVVFSPNGSLLAMNGKDGTVYCRDMATGNERAFTGRADRGQGLAFSPDGRLLISTGKEAVVFDVETGNVKYRAKHGQSWIACALFLPDGKWFLTGGWDSSTRLWNAETGEFRAKFHCQGGVDRIVYSATTRSFAACTGPVIYVHHLEFGPPSPELAKRIADELKRLDDDGISVREAANAALQAIGFPAEAALAQAEENSPSAEVRIGARRAASDPGETSNHILYPHRRHLGSDSLPRWQTACLRRR
jgi:hypothetical protein